MYTMGTILRHGNAEQKKTYLPKIARDRWLAIGRELQRLDLIRATPGLRSVLEMTEHGRKTLLERRPVELTVDVTPTHRSPVVTASRDGGYDADAFETLRTLRKKIADDRDVPAYVIFPDTTLRTMARDLPTTPEEMRRVPGVGDKKTRGLRGHLPRGTK